MAGVLHGLVEDVEAQEMSEDEAIARALQMCPPGGHVVVHRRACQASQGMGRCTCEPVTYVAGICA